MESIERKRETAEQQSKERETVFVFGGSSVIVVCSKDLMP